MHMYTSYTTWSYNILLKSHRQSNKKFQYQAWETPYDLLAKEAKRLPKQYKL